MGLMRDEFVLRAMRLLKVREPYEDAVARDDVNDIADALRQLSAVGPRFIILKNYDEDASKQSFRMTRFNVSHILGYERAEDPTLTKFHVVGGEFLVEESPEQIDFILMSLGASIGGHDD